MAFSKVELVALKTLEKKFVVVAELTIKESANKLFADTPPLLLMENRELLFESKISKIFAACPVAAKIVIAVEAEDVD